MFKKIKENKKGFTLAELLIVVAIIAVLVAVAIPVFTSQLNKSQLATDTANVRAAYAEVVATALADGQTNDAGNLTVSFTDPSQYSTATVDNTTHTVTVTHNKDGNLKNSFDIDDNVTLTISGSAAE